MHTAPGGILGWCPSRPCGRFFSVQYQSHSFFFIHSFDSHFSTDNPSTLQLVAFESSFSLVFSWYQSFQICTRGSWAFVYSNNLTNKMWIYAPFFPIVHNYVTFFSFNCHFWTLSPGRLGLAAMESSVSLLFHDHRVLRIASRVDEL